MVVRRYTYYAKKEGRSPQRQPAFDLPGEFGYRRRIKDGIARATVFDS